MKFSSAISIEPDPTKAVDHLCQDIRRQLGNLPCHFVLWFFSLRYVADWEALARRIQSTLGEELTSEEEGPVLVGCSGGGVIGVDREIEFVPAMSLLAAHLPEVEVRPFAVTQEELEREEMSDFWIEKIGVEPRENPCLIVLPEPYSCDAMRLVSQLESVFTGMPIVGGLASGADIAGENVLVLNHSVMNEGAVGLALTGNIRLETLVSQGCRPIGHPLVVTKAEGNVIFELAGRGATRALLEVLSKLPRRDQELAQHSLFIGIASDESKDHYGRGDFLVRNLVGADAEREVLAIGDRIEVGQTVQFQLRDGDTSHEDLTALLSKRAEELKKSPPAGALLFSCLGRGQHLYGVPHHDIRTLRELTGNFPIGGFFCNGEIGPISGKTFVHGYTSSIGFFRTKASS